MRTRLIVGLAFFWFTLLTSAHTTQAGGPIVPGTGTDMPEIPDAKASVDGSKTNTTYKGLNNTTIPAGNYNPANWKATKVTIELGNRVANVANFVPLQGSPAIDGVLDPAKKTWENQQGYADLPKGKYSLRITLLGEKMANGGEVPLCDPVLQDVEIK